MRSRTGSRSSVPRWSWRSSDATTRWWIDCSVIAGIMGVDYSEAAVAARAEEELRRRQSRDDRLGHPRSATDCRRCRACTARTARNHRQPAWARIDRRPLADARRRRAGLRSFRSEPHRHAVLHVHALAGVGRAARRRWPAARSGTHASLASPGPGMAASRVVASTVAIARVGCRRPVGHAAHCRPMEPRRPDSLPPMWWGAAPEFLSGRRGMARAAFCSRRRWSASVVRPAACSPSGRQASRVDRCGGDVSQPWPSGGLTASWRSRASSRSVVRPAPS